MICDFCGKVREQQPNKWINYETQEEYKICDFCVAKIKNNSWTN